MNFKPIAAAALLAVAAWGSSASATVVLYDNFDGEGPGDDLVWNGDSVFVPTSPPSSVDLIGVGGSYDFLPGNGSYLDLDGSSGSGLNPAGEITSISSFGAGTYTLTFLLAGNQRGAANQTTKITLGDWTTSINLASGAGFAAQAFTFTTTGGSLVFTEMGPSNQQGNLLDEVKLSAVPEPTTWAMMIVGFGLTGSMVRSARRKQAFA
ncbi:PEPxxWA-CTERM sorting domain-containing protein [Phenylobacterium sp.]|uniref:PEPxxWA-CTERM sorting domain-containing protein n=1 Tax=Phenylobacterium sp. TaxID=1871053 RepID=UPI00286BEE6C|nr:PEPxxWA-CTERM sorting domain-containing protein [Phenylobacterium sp.]